MYPASFEQFGGRKNVFGVHYQDEDCPSSKSEMYSLDARIQEPCHCAAQVQDILQKIRCTNTKGYQKMV